MDIIPSKDSFRCQVLTNLSSRLSTRYSQKRSIEDLNRAIEVLSEALKLTPIDDPVRASRASSLGGLLVMRHKETKSMEDLDHAIQIADEAMKETQTHKFDRLLALRESGAALGYRSARNGDAKIVSRIVEINDEALALLPKDHPHRSLRLTNLGIALVNRFEHSGSIEDINRAVQVIDEAVESTPLDHVARVERSGMLGDWLARRYTCTESIEDSDRAIEVSSEAVKSTNLRHPGRTTALFNLGHVLVSRVERTHSFDIIDPFLTIFEESWDSDIAPISQRILAAELTAYLLDLKSDWDGSCSLMEKAVEFLACASPSYLRHADKEYGLKSHSGLASRAAYYALRANKAPYEILRLLEIGRGIIANFLMDLREDLTYIKQDSDLMANFVCLRNDLDKPGEQKAHSWATSTALSYELEDKKRRETSTKLGEVIEQIRNQPGMSEFLLPPSEDVFRAAAELGPIIVINADSFRCDAVFIEHHQIRVLNLPDLTFEAVESHVRSLRQFRTTHFY